MAQNLLDFDPRLIVAHQGAEPRDLVSLLPDLRVHAPLHVVDPAGAALAWDEGRARLWACECASRAVDAVWDPDNESDGTNLYGALLTGREVARGERRVEYLYERLVELRITDWFDESPRWKLAVDAVYNALGDDRFAKTPYGASLREDRWAADAATLAARVVDDPEERLWQARKLVEIAGRPVSDSPEPAG